VAGSGRTVNSAAANGVKELTLCDTRDRVAGPPSSASAEGGLRRGKQGPALLNVNGTIRGGPAFAIGFGVASKPAG
jgi:hypothetical protein